MADEQKTPDELAQEHTKEELAAKAEEQGVEVKASDTKADIAEKLSDAPAGDDRPAGVSFQSPSFGAPTQPAASGGGPQDALDPATRAGNDPQVPLTGAETPTPGGPEDALDPHVENAGDYSTRVEDAPHFTHEEIPADEQVFGGPVSRPVAQNEAASQDLKGSEQDAASDK